MNINAFDPSAPDWAETASHAQGFCCPQCQLSPSKAKSVWINRRSPVYDQERQRKWQEFYLCACDCAWWGWSSDRPTSELSSRYSSDLPPLL